MDFYSTELHKPFKSHSLRGLQRLSLEVSALGRGREGRGEQSEKGLGRGHGAEE